MSCDPSALASTVTVPSAETAGRLVAVAVAHGEALGIAVAAAVVDPCGRMMAFLTHPAAPVECSAIARDKASTSAGFRVATTALLSTVSGNDALREGLTARGSVILFGGGFPISFGGEHGGGIGVSGGSEEQDAACAKAALRAVIGHIE